MPIYHVGQDEAIFKQNCLPSYSWSYLSRTRLRPKNEGQGIMVSAFFSEHKGMGERLTRIELKVVNDWREERGKTHFNSSPGIAYFNYGKNREGYWGNEQTRTQVQDVLDMLEALFPGVQILVEVDHSSAHLKRQDNGLTVSEMGLNWGGKKGERHSTIIVDETCLGPNPPILGDRCLMIGLHKRIYENLFYIIYIYVIYY